MENLDRQRADDGDGAALDLHAWSHGVEWPVWRYAVRPETDERAWTGGVLENYWPSDLGRPGPDVYNIAARAQDVLKAALMTDPTQRSALLEFASSWGQLGVGLGLSVQETSRDRPAVDSVWATQRALTSLQRQFRWLRALQQQRWISSDIPSAYTGDVAAFMDAALTMVAPPERPAVTEEVLSRAMIAGHDDPYLSSFAQGNYLARRARIRTPARSLAEMHWRAFSVAMSPHLRRITPTISWDPLSGPIRSWSLRRPIDAAWATLWDWATRGGQLTRCRHCRNWFPGDLRGKAYCSTACANRASSAAWYRLRGRRQRRVVAAGSDREGFVAPASD